MVLWTRTDTDTWSSTPTGVITEWLVPESVSQMFLPRKDPKRIADSLAPIHVPRLCRARGIKSLGVSSQASRSDSVTTSWPRCEDEPIYRYDESSTIADLQRSTELKLLEETLGSQFDDLSIEVTPDDTALFGSITFKAIIHCSRQPFWGAPSARTDLLECCLPKLGDQRVSAQGSKHRIAKQSRSKRSRDPVDDSIATSLVSAPSTRGGTIGTLCTHEFPDFFYVHDPIKYTVYAWNCSKNHSRHYDFFNRNLGYHFKAGHFHDEFGSSKAATAAYWRTFNATPDTSAAGKPGYKELQYKVKLEALWGKEIVEMPRCLGHGSHVPYSITAKELPYQLPEPAECNPHSKEPNSACSLVLDNRSGASVSQTVDHLTESTNVAGGNSAALASSTDKASVDTGMLQQLLSDLQRKANANWSETTNGLLLCQTLLGTAEWEPRNSVTVAQDDGNHEAIAQMSTNGQSQVMDTSACSVSEEAAALTSDGMDLPATSVTSYFDATDDLDPF